jgi:hypothetical protein
MQTRQSSGVTALPTCMLAPSANQSPSRRFPGLPHPDIQNLIDVFANAQPSGSRETIGKDGDVSLRNHSTAPHGQQLLG